MTIGVSRRVRRLLFLVVVLVVLFVGGPFVYIHFIEGSAPPSFTLSGPGASGGSTKAVPLAGTWHVAEGSQVGYRVKEILFGQDNTAVGRTHEVSGEMTISGTSVQTASFTAQMADVTSNESPRDGQFRGRIMDVAKYPTATFALTRPIPIGTPPPSGVVRSYAAAGELTLRGVTRPVRMTLHARHVGGTIEVQGEVPILFANWKIPNPSFGPVTTQDHGILEFLLDFTPGAPTPTTTTTTTPPSVALQAYAACMKAHGVTLARPGGTRGPRPGGPRAGGPPAGGPAVGGGPGSGRGGPGGPGATPPNPKTEAAEKACAALLPAGFGPPQAPSGPLPTIAPFSL